MIGHPPISTLFPYPPLSQSFFSSPIILSPPLKPLLRPLRLPRPSRPRPHFSRSLLSVLLPTISSPSWPRILRLVRASKRVCPCSSPRSLTSIGKIGRASCRERV